MKKHWLKLMILLCLSALLAGLCACAAPPSPAEREALKAEYAKTALSLTVDDPAELAVLENYTFLEKLDLSGSSCYKEIEDYIAAHPSVDVTYTVALGADGTVLSNKAESVLLEKGSYVSVLAENIRSFPVLAEIVISSPDFSMEDLLKIREKCPADIYYRMSPDLPDIPYNSTEINLSALTPEHVDNSAAFLDKMPLLENIDVTASDGTNLLSFTDLRKLQDAAPDVLYDYRFDSFGQTVSVADESLEYLRVYIYNSGLDQIREMMPCMTALKSMYFEYCQIDYDVLAQFRDDFPDVDIVWRVDFGPYSQRTDTERIFANGSLDSYSVYNLRYCTRVKYIDMGHNPNVGNIDFTAFMPDLEIAIFADTAISDLSPLANCKKLRYLEIFVTNVWDLSPLASCTELEHLNVSCDYSLRDLSPLFGLTKLKRLWNTFSNVPKAQRDEMMSLMPDCEFCFARITSTGNHWRYNANGSRNEYYEELAQVFGYDNWQDNISWW